MDLARGMGRGAGIFVMHCVKQALQTCSPSMCMTDIQSQIFVVDTWPLANAVRGTRSRILQGRPLL